MGEAQGPLMLDLTRISKKPPTKHALGGFMVEWRVAAFVALGVALAAPVVWLLARFSFYVPAIMLTVISGGVGLMASSARPDGQSIPKYLWGALSGKGGKHEVDGEMVKVYVGLCPVLDFHDEKPVILQHAHVPVRPEHVDERGALKF